MCLNGSYDDDVQNHLVYSDLVSILRIREVWIIAIFTWENIRLFVLVNSTDKNFVGLGHGQLLIQNKKARQKTNSATLTF